MRFVISGRPGTVLLGFTAAPGGVLTRIPAGVTK
jgi:hypothetical protein